MISSNTQTSSFEKHAPVFMCVVCFLMIFAFVVSSFTYTDNTCEYCGKKMELTAITDNKYVWICDACHISKETEKLPYDYDIVIEKYYTR